MDLLDLLPDHSTFSKITTKSFRAQLIYELYDYDIDSAYNHEQFGLYDSDGIAFNHYHLFYAMGFVFSLENYGSARYGTVPNREDETSVVEEFVMMVYKVFAPLVFFINGDDQRINLETFEELVDPENYASDWKRRRKYESTLLKIVKSIVKHLNSKDNSWLECRTDSVNNDDNLAINDPLISMPNLSVYCVFILFYKMLSTGFVKQIYKQMIGNSDYVFEHPSMHQVAREHTDIAKTGGQVMMSNVFEIINNTFDELNQKASEISDNNNTSNSNSDSNNREPMLSKLEIDGAFERHIENQLVKFRKEQEMYYLKQLTNKLHVRGRQTGIPASVSNLGGVLTQFVANPNTIQNAKTLRNSARRTSSGGSKGKTRKLNKNNKKRKIKIKK